MEAIVSANKPKNMTIRPYPGITLNGRYTLVDQIGEGATSYIFTATDNLSNNPFQLIAVKIARDSDETSYDQLILHEANINKQLSNKNVVKIFEHYQEESLCFLTMEHIKGETLGRLLSRLPNRQLPRKRAMEITQKIAQALHDIHQQGVIHSDLKPDNIMITDQGEVKLLDFATARQNALNSTNIEISPPPFYGYTAAYASPETIEDKAPFPSDDIFSLGCISYEMLTGKHPYNRMPSNGVSRWTKIKKPKNINPLTWVALKKALELNRQKRYKNALQFNNNLRRATLSIKNVTKLAIAASFVYLSLTGIQSITKPAWSLNDEQQLAYQQMEAISELPIDVRITALEQQNKDNLISQGALRLTRTSTTQALLEHIENELSQDLPNFNNLNTLTLSLLGVYPDSMRLIEAKESINSAKTAKVSKLRQDYEQLWHEVLITQNTVIKANHIIEQLNHLDAMPTLSDATIGAFENKISTAYKNLDHQKVILLSQLGEKLPLTNPDQALKPQTLKIMESAKDLANHKPFIDNFIEELSSAWSDTQLMELKAKLESSRQELSRNELVYQIISKEFAKKVKYQIDIKRQNAEKAEHLERLLRDIG